MTTHEQHLGAQLWNGALTAICLFLLAFNIAVGYASWRLRNMVDVRDELIKNYVMLLEHKDAQLEAMETGLGLVEGGYIEAENFLQAAEYLKGAGDDRKAKPGQAMRLMLRAVVRGEPMDEGRPEIRHILCKQLVMAWNPKHQQEVVAGSECNGEKPRPHRLSDPSDINRPLRPQGGYP